MPRNLRVRSHDDGFRVPHVVVVAMHEGRHRVRVWREYRRMTQEALATAAKLSTPCLSQIEGRKRGGSTRTLRRIAAALQVPVDTLVNEAG